MQQRRGTAAQWTSTNSGNGPVLNAGEIGFEIDNNRFKIGDGVNHWVDLPYFANNEAISDLIDGAPALLDTLNEIAAAIGDDPAFFTTVGTNLSNHQSDTTNIHGIADTSLLATKSYADQAETDAIAAAGTAADSKISTHNADTTDVHGIADTAALATRTYADNAASQAVAALVASAPSTLDTLNELAAAIADNPNYATDVANLVATKADISYVDSEISSVGGDISDHASLTTNVHGIANTADLATQDYVTDAIANSTDAYPDLAGDGISWNAGSLAFDVDNTVARTSATDLLASIEYVDSEITAVRDDAAVAAAGLLTGATKSNITITGDKNGLTITAENGVADSTTDNLSEGTNNLYFSNERAQDAVGNAVGTGLAYTDSTGVIAVDTTVIQARVTNITDTEIGYLDGLSSNIQTQIDTKAALVSPTFTGTVSGITKSMVGLPNVDNTSDANKPVSTAQASAIATAKSEAIADATSQVNAVIAGAPAALNTLDELAAALGDDANFASTLTTSLAAKAPLDAPTFTGTVSGITKSMVGLGNVDNTSDSSKPISSATQTALDAKLASSTAASTYAPIASPTFTGTVSGVTKSMVGLGNVDNTTDANKPVSTAAQTALDLKAPIANPTFTGTVAGITKSMVGLGNVDNTADSAKPVSTAAQTALDAKLNLSGGTLTGALTLSGAPTSDLHAATKLYVDGIASGINFHAPVLASTFANITADYANGTNGEGATLTAPSNAAIGTIDGVTLSLNSRVLVRAQTDAKQNGIYVVTNLGSGSSKWVLTRATDADNNPSGELKGGDFCFVTSGTLYANTGFILSGTSAIAIGTDNVNYVQFNAAQAIIAGSGITKDGATLSIGTGAITSDMIANGAIVDADVNASAAIAQSKISGLTSDLAAKAPLANPTFTGTVAGITKGMVGLGNVDNTTDAGKPISTATQTALDAKLATATAASTYAPLASPTFTGTVTLPTGTVTSGMILDGTIVDADISATAAIAQSKISGLSTSLGLKADLASPALTGTPTAPTAAAGTNTTQVATTAFVGTAVADLVASAPSALNTLNELATALGNDASFSTTVTNAIAAKSNTASPTFTGTVTIPTLTLTNPLTAANGGTGLSSLGTGVATFLGTPSSANFAAMLTDEIGTGSVVLSEVATSAQTASYTLVAADRGKLVEMNVGSANNLTVPLDSSVNFPVGTQIDILQVGSGQTTVVATGGVTINGTPGLKIRAQWGGATLIKRAANTWVLIGDLTV